MTGEKEESVHLALLPSVIKIWKDEELAERWKKVIEVRQEVTKALEEARVKKLIGHSLDALIAIDAENDLFTLLDRYSAELKTIFITSGVLLSKNGSLPGAVESREVKGLYISVEPAPGKKCERCWIYDLSVGTTPEEPRVCKRCLGALEEIRKA